jgi:YesN/AraC family two-component response regulator
LPLLQGLSNQFSASQPEQAENALILIPADFSDFSCSGYTILVVEDKKELRDFLHDSFKAIFKHSYTANDGVEALDIIKTRQPDIVVSDVMMPRMDGFELCRQVKNTIEISHIPVVLLTARSDQDSTMLGYKLGADFYVSKPFELEFLMTIVKNILQTRENVKQKYKQYSFNLLPQESTISNADEIFMMKFNKIISENLSNPDLTIEYLTDTMAMSRASLYNKVKALTDMGVNDYINKIRIEKAAQLLIKSDMNIAEISCEVGFTYQRYFSSLFKKCKGLTPSEFRDRNREAGK